MVRFKLDDEEEETEKEVKEVFKGRLEDKIDEVLLKERKLFFSSAVDDLTARDAIRKLWYLDHIDPGKPILFIINSPGGSVDSGFAIWDQAKMLKSPIITLITGLAASMGSILSLCAKKENRFATPHSRIMIHQPAIHGVVRGQATDLEIQAKEILKTRDIIINLYVDATGRDFDTIQKALDRDTWMSADEAVGFGLIHKVINSYEDLNKLLKK